MVLHRVCPGCRRARGAVCARCLARCDRIGRIEGLAGLDGAGALVRYDPTVQRMIVAAKNQGRRDVLRQLGALLAGSAPAAVTASPTLVTWIPASRVGRRRRGYDQSEILAGAVAAALGLSCRRLLGRRRGRGQTGRDRLQRLDGPVFLPIRPAFGSAPESVLLVDDVITTGASMAEAARQLRSGGIRSVFGLSVAWTANEAEAAAGRVISGSHRQRA